jgi:hypothetical protein
VRVRSPRRAVLPPAAVAHATQTELGAGNAADAAAGCLGVLRLDPSFLPAIVLLLFAARVDPSVVVVPRARLFDDEILDLAETALEARVEGHAHVLARLRAFCETARAADGACAGAGGRGGGAGGIVSGVCVC